MSKLQNWIEQEFTVTDAALRQRRAEVEAENQRLRESNEARRIEDEARQHKERITEEERRRKIEEKKQNESLSNILGWASLALMFCGPLILLMPLVSAGFLVLYFRAVPEKRRGGHTTGLIVAFISLIMVVTTTCNSIR